MPKARMAVVVSLLISPLLFAQNNRSAVSLTGVDTATCTVPDPCRTFDVAISRTNAGGEVIVLSSAGYGPFTVNKSISIISPPAYHAAMAPTSGNAVTIDVDNALVVLRGLTLNGSPGLRSVASIDHALMERNAYDGLRVENASVAIRDSVAAVNSAGSGFWAYAGASGTEADLTAENCQATHNGWGFIQALVPGPRG